MNVKVRIEFLDGLRGVAAFIVFVGHYNMYFNNLGDATNYTSQLPAILQLPLEALLLFVGNGNLSVSLFFVLSGFVLSYSYFVSPSADLLISYSIKRYPRLTLPILVSVLSVFFLFYFHLFYSQDTLRTLGITGRLPFYDGMIVTGPLIALKEGLYGCILLGTSYHNEVLWTMSIEFFGSLLVFAVLGIFGKSPLRFLVYFLLHLYLINSFYYLFITGVLFADLSTSKPKWNLPVLGYFLVSTGFFISVFYYNKTLYSLLSSGDLTEIKRFAINRIAAILIVAGVLIAHPLKNIFTNRILLMLGKISFVLYLFHTPFISIVSVFFLKELLSFLPYNISIHWVFMITAVLLPVLCYYFLIYIDKAGIMISNWISKEIQSRFLLIKDKMP